MHRPPRNRHALLPGRDVDVVGLLDGAPVQPIADRPTVSSQRGDLDSRIEETTWLRWLSEVKESAAGRASTVLARASLL